MTDYVEEIEFVLSEVARIAGKDPRDALKLSFPENLAMLPHPSGTGNILCGAAAYKRLQDVAHLALSRSRYAGCLDPQAVFQHLTSIIVQRFMRDRRELSTKEASRSVSSAIRAAAIACDDFTHFVPCHLGHIDTPDNFSIGPVSFQQRGKIFERLEPALQA